MATGSVSPKIGKVVDIPNPPTIGTATAGGESASVTFTAPTLGGPIVTYRALSNPGSIAGTGTTSPISVTGLTAGTAYTFQVRGENSTGNSEYSSASNSATPTVSTSYESIATVTVGSGGSSAINFSSIPATYSHLQIRGISRDARAVTVNTLNVRVGNGSVDSGSNYATHYLDGDGASATAGAATSYTSMAYMIEPGANANASVFGGFVIDLLDYANTNKYKTFRALGGTDNNGSGQITLVSGLWMSTSAITNIQLFNNASANFSQYTTFALYGIKGA